MCLGTCASGAWRTRCIEIHSLESIRSIGDDSRGTAKWESKPHSLISSGASGKEAFQTSRLYLRVSYSRIADPVASTFLLSKELTMAIACINSTYSSDVAISAWCSRDGRKQCAEV